MGSWTRRLWRSGAGFALIAFAMTARAQVEVSAASSTAGAQEQNIFDLQALAKYDGAVIRSISISGARWTRERAIRWLLSQKEGDAFEAGAWAAGIHKIYDTTDVYDVSTQIRAAETPNSGPIASEIDVTVSVDDRWTLMPFVVAQSGGGSTNFGVGAAETNLFGYFGQLAASYSVFNDVHSYDLNYFQEFIADTPYIAGFDVSSVGVPVSLQKNSGEAIGSFVWNRQQEQVLFGRKFEPKTSSRTSKPIATAWSKTTERPKCACIPGNSTECDRR